MKRKYSEMQKQNIINVAKYHFYHDGYKNTTFRMIAKDIGINHSTIFYYFSDKEQIVKDIFKNLYRNYNEEIQRIDSSCCGVEFLLTFIEINSVFFSTDEKFRSLYFEVMDIIVDVLYQYYAQWMMKDRTITTNDEQNRYLMDWAVCTYAVKNLYSLNDSGFIKLNYAKQELKEYLQSLVFRVFEIDKAAFDTACKRARQIAAQVDYEQLNIFKNCVLPSKKSEE